MHVTLNTKNIVVVTRRFWVLYLTTRTNWDNHCSNQQLPNINQANTIKLTVAIKLVRKRVECVATISSDRVQCGDTLQESGIQGHQIAHLLRMQQMVEKIVACTQGALKHGGPVDHNNDISTLTSDACIYTLVTLSLHLGGGGWCSGIGATCSSLGIGVKSPRSTFGN